LDEEPKNEIKAPLQSPTEVVKNTNTFEAKQEVVEPYLKKEELESIEAKVEITQPIVSIPVPEEKVIVPEVQKEQPKLELDWEINTNVSAATNNEVREPEVKRYVLDDDTESKLDLSDRTAKTIQSPEEQQRLAQERLERIQLYTAKLRKTDGISALENEPAFVRRNIQLDDAKPSTDSKISRFGLTEDGMKSNNSFLHDNVD